MSSELNVYVGAAVIPPVVNIAKTGKPCSPRVLSIDEIEEDTEGMFTLEGSRETKVWIPNLSAFGLHYDDSSSDSAQIIDVPFIQKNIELLKKTMKEYIDIIESKYQVTLEYTYVVASSMH